MYLFINNYSITQRDWSCNYSLNIKIFIYSLVPKATHLLTSTSTPGSIYQYVYLFIYIYEGEREIYMYYWLKKTQKNKKIHTDGETLLLVSVRYSMWHKECSVSLGEWLTNSMRACNALLWSERDRNRNLARWGERDCRVSAFVVFSRSSLTIGLGSLAR